MIDWSAGRGFVTAGGSRLEWGAFGAAPGSREATIVLLHEGLGCLTLWRDFPARLAEATGRPVFAYSRAGYGRSDPCALPRPLDYMTREAVQVLPGILDALGADAVVLMGHSDGATIAAEYGGRVRDARLRGLVLMAPHFFSEPIGLAAIAQAGRDFENGDLRRRLAKYHADAEVAFRGWNDAWLDPAFRGWNVADAIDGIGVPILALQGRQDQYGTLAQLDEIEARARVPVARQVLEDCRHAPHLDRPEAVLQAVADFIGGLG